MSSRRGKSRIERIKLELTPKEELLYWLAKLPPIESMQEFKAWIVKQSAGGSHPIRNLAGEVAKAVRTPLVDRTSWHDADKAVQQAWQEVYFLYLLYVELNVHGVGEASACAGTCQDVIPELARGLEEGPLLWELRKALPPPADAPPTDDPTAHAMAGRCLAICQARLADLRKEAEPLMITIYEAELVVEIINRRYFDGLLPLWRRVSRFLDPSPPDSNPLKVLTEQLKAADQFLEATGMPVVDKLNLDDIRQAADARAGQTVKRLVTMARVGALRRLGKVEEARALLARHVKEAGKYEAEEFLEMENLDEW